MNVFMTSATGYVGAAVAKCLQARGHLVTALARTVKSAERLRANRINPVAGELAHPETYITEAAQADVAIHTAFEYLDSGAENSALDICVTQKLLQTIGTLRRQQLIYTSNAYLPGVSSEQLVAPPMDARATPLAWRLSLEHKLLAASSGLLTTAVLRPGMVYGGHGGGTIATLFKAARYNGQLPYLQSAADNHWSLIYLHDLAALYATLAETNSCGVFHAVDSQPMSLKRVFDCVSSITGVPASTRGEAVVRAMLEPHTVDIMSTNVALSAPRARQLGWTPRYRNFEEGASHAYSEWREQTDFNTTLTTRI